MAGRMVEHGSAGVRAPSELIRTAAARLRVGGSVRIRGFGGAACTVVALLRGGGALVRTGTGLEISVPPSELLPPN